MYACFIHYCICYYRDLYSDYCTTALFAWSITSFICYYMLIKTYSLLFWLTQVIQLHCFIRVNVSLSNMIIRCQHGQAPSTGEKVHFSGYPAVDVLLQMIHCNCSWGCKTLRCTYRKHMFKCTSACGHSQYGNCDNVTNKSVPEEDATLDITHYKSNSRGFTWLGH